MILNIIFIALAYAVGSLSSAIIVCQVMHLPDPRTQGSKNPGATNVLRIGGKTPALITLAGDVLKALIPVLLAHLFGVSGFFLGMVALAAFIGHLFPVFFQFEGGKGVATALGGLLGLSLFTGLAAVVIWVAVAGITRYSSLAALITAAAAPFILLIFGHASYFLPALAMSALLVWRHLGNIQRLRAGTETKINF